MKKLIELNVNGEKHEVAVAPNQTLLEVLREDLHLTGSKESCDLGSCGACTVLMDKKAVLSCMILAVDVKEREILTIEGLAKNNEPHPLQKSFHEKGAVQCGYCTSGMILTAKAFLERKPDPTKDEVKEAISGNLCRCTGYAKIVEAILSVKQVHQK